MGTLELLRLHASDERMLQVESSSRVDERNLASARQRRLAQWKSTPPAVGKCSLVRVGFMINALGELLQHAGTTARRATLLHNKIQDVRLGMRWLRSRHGTSMHVHAPVLAKALCMSGGVMDDSPAFAAQDPDRSDGATLRVPT